jgi:hypothetical protein
MRIKLNNILIMNLALILHYKPSYIRYEVKASLICTWQLAIEKFPPTKLCKNIAIIVKNWQLK